MPANEILALAMFIAFIALVFTGFPVAWILAGLAVLFTALAIVFEVDLHLAIGVDWAYASLSVERVWNVMENWVMVALPMFIFMGLLLDRSGIADRLMTSFARLFGRVGGGLAISVALIGVLLAATTGIIGASVVLLALLGLPAMLRTGYDRSLASGTVCAVGTLGILIPPSIMLVVMADRMAMSVGDLFLGAVFPGLLLGALYVSYLVGYGLVRPEGAPKFERAERIDFAAIRELLLAIVPPSLLIVAVLGSIFFGLATPTEAAGVGAAGALLLALANRALNRRVMTEVLRETTRTTAFIFGVLIGATAFSLVLRGLGGDETDRGRAPVPAFRPYGHHHLHTVRDIPARFLPRLDRADPDHPAAGCPGGGDARLRPGVVHGNVRGVPADEFPDAAGGIRHLLPEGGRPAGSARGRHLPGRRALHPHTDHRPDGHLSTGTRS